MARCTGWIVASAAIVALAGCEARKRDPSPRSEDATMTTPSTPAGGPSAAQLAELRAEVIAKLPPFRGRPEYAVTDPAFLDPCIASALREQRMPTAAERSDFLWHATTCVTNKLATTEGLELLRGLIQRRYDRPVIAREGDLVRIDVGVVAGTKLSVLRNVTTVVESPHIDKHEWSASEVVRHLRLAMAAHPDAQTYQAEVEIPTRGGNGDFTYVYDRADDRIRKYTSDRPTEVYVTEKLEGNLERVTSLHFTATTRQNSTSHPRRSFPPT